MKKILMLMILCLSGCGEKQQKIESPTLITPVHVGQGHGLDALDFYTFTLDGHDYLVVAGVRSVAICPKTETPK